MEELRSSHVCQKIVHIAEFTIPEFIIKTENRSSLFEPPKFTLFSVRTWWKFRFIFRSSLRTCGVRKKEVHERWKKEVHFGHVKKKKFTSNTYGGSLLKKQCENTKRNSKKYGFCILKTAPKPFGISKNILHRKVTKFL